MIGRSQWETYLMTHERCNRAKCFIAVMRLCCLHHLTRVTKSLVIVGQRQGIILGREEAIELVEDEVLRVSEHVVEGSYAG
jgi:hypothetical protein